MLILDDARKEFSSFLAENPEARWRLDAALAHVVQWAYAKGCKDTEINYEQCKEESLQEKG